MPYKQGVTGSSPVVSTKKAEDTPSAFCCPQQSSVRRCRRTPYGGTSDFVTADAYGKALFGIPVRLFRWLSAVRLRRCDCLTSRLCNRLPFRSLFRLTLCSLQVQLFPPKKPRIHPRLFAVRNSPLCGDAAARLTAEPVTLSLLTLTERRRAAFPSEFSLTLRRTAPFVRIPLISPVCAFAFPFAIPSHFVLLTSPVVSTQKAEVCASAFCCAQQSSVRSRRTPYGGTGDDHC